MVYPTVLKTCLDAIMHLVKNGFPSPVPKIIRGMQTKSGIGPSVNSRQAHMFHDVLDSPVKLIDTVTPITIKNSKIMHNAAREFKVSRLCGFIRICILAGEFTCKDVGDDSDDDDLNSSTIDSEVDAASDSVGVASVAKCKLKMYSCSKLYIILSENIFKHNIILYCPTMRLLTLQARRYMINMRAT